MTLDRDETMYREPLEEALRQAGCKIRNSNCTCPWHDDETPSAQIRCAAGHWRVTCYKCDRFGDVFDIRSHSSGRPLSEVIPKEARRGLPKPKWSKGEAPPLILPDKASVAAWAAREGTVAKWYVYGPKDDPKLIVARIHRPDGKKTFRQFTPQPNGKYAAKNLNEHGSLPLYRQDELSGHQTVLVVEGEKSCDAAWDLGIPATTSCMGAGKFDWSDWSALEGKHVVLWPDNDEVGRKHMAGVAEILGMYGCSLQMIDPEGIGMSSGGDIADLVAEWGDPTERERSFILTLMADAERLGATVALDEWHRKISEGKWQSLDWPLVSLGRLARATMPGSFTLLCADPGAGKSWLMLQLMRHWNNQGHRAVVRMFEDDAKAHMARLLAQMTGNGKHTDDRWIADNRQQVEDDKARFRAELDILGARIIPETKEIWTHTDLGDWCERHAKAGSRVIIADPITALKSSDKPWLQDFELVMRLKDIAYKYECSILVTTHPRGSVREPSMAGLAGGVAWSRFAHCILWLEMLPQEEEAPMLGREPALINRRMRILKSRHGKGSGAQIGLMFGNDVNFHEAGIIGRAKPEQPKRKPTQERMNATPSPSEDVF